jgi:hypothetical protein
MPHQHEVEAAKPGGVLNSHDIRRRLDDAQLRFVPPAGRAYRAQFMLSEHATALAMADSLHRFTQRARQGGRTIAIPFKQMKGYALRRLATNARHATQGIDHLNQQW